MADSAQRLSELEVTSPGPCQRPQLPPPDPLKLNESTCSRQRWASCSVLTTNPAMTLRRRAALHTLLQAATENSSTLEVQSSATVFHIKPADILEELRQEIKQRGQRLVPSASQPWNNVRLKTGFFFTKLGSARTLGTPGVSSSISTSAKRETGMFNNSEWPRKNVK